MSKLPVKPTKINTKSGSGTPGSFSGANYKPSTKEKPVVKSKTDTEFSQ